MGEWAFAKGWGKRFNEMRQGKTQERASPGAHERTTVRTISPLFLGHEGRPKLEFQSLRVGYVRCMATYPAALCL